MAIHSQRTNEAKRLVNKSPKCRPGRQIHVLDMSMHCRHCKGGGANLNLALFVGANNHTISVNAMTMAMFYLESYTVLCISTLSK